MPWAEALWHFSSFCKFVVGLVKSKNNYLTKIDFWIAKHNEISEKKLKNICWMPANLDFEDLGKLTGLLNTNKFSDFVLFFLKEQFFLKTICKNSKSD